MRRPAAAIAAANGWRAESWTRGGATHGEATRAWASAGAEAQVGGHALEVIGDDLTAGAILWVHTESLAHDADARRASDSEHITRVLRRLPERRSRVGPVHALLLERPGGGTLEERLGAGPPLRAGEAVTILLGVATALSDLHAAGWGGALTRPAYVAFRTDGCPVLAWLERPVPLDDDAEAADRRAFRSLSRAVCDAIPGDEGRRLLETVADVTALRGWERLRGALLREAQPGVVSVPARGPLGKAPHARADAAGSDGAETDDPHEYGAASSGGAAGGGLITPADDRRPAWPERMLATIESRPLVRWIRGVSERVRRRPGLIVVALAPAALAGALLVLLPGTDSGAHGSPSELATSASAAVDRSNAPQTPSEPIATASPPSPQSPSPASGLSTSPSPPAASSPSPSPGAASSPSPSPPSARASGDTSTGVVGRDPLLGDDPVAAARVLVERRHACFAARRPSAGCLEAVVQKGSELLRTEEAGLGERGAASARDYGAADVTLVQRWARAALVTVEPGAPGGPGGLGAPGSAGSIKREPASLLLVRGEAGWRLREVFP